MKKLITLSLSLALCLGSLSAQFGISVGYVFFDAEDYSIQIDGLSGLDPSSSNFKQGTAQFAVDYWFRLKNKRIEFLPEISFFRATASIAQTTAIDAAFEHDFNLNVFQFNFNAHIYPFDFAGDCDCPTFSKDGDLLKKGFFIRLAPGFSANNFRESFSVITIAGASSGDVNNSDSGFSMRAGIGLDIGLSDFITVTPIAQYTHILPTSGFEYFINAATPIRSASSLMTQLYFGLRLGFRFDELNKYGYR